MSVIFQDHLDGTNGASLVALTNCNYGQTGVSSGNTLTFDTSTSAAGSSSAKAVQTASYTAADVLTPAFTATSTIYRRMCFRLSTLPNGNLFISQMITTAGAITTRLGINSSSHLTVYDGTTLVNAGTTTLASNTWYRIEWDIVGTASTLRLYPSPTSTSVTETVNTTITGTAFVKAVDGIVASGNSNLVTLWFDEVVNDSAATPGPVTGIPATTAGAVGFAGTSTSNQSAHSAGAVGFSGASRALVSGGAIAGLADNFAGTTVDVSKWVVNGGATQNYGAVVPAKSPMAAFTSASSWNASGSVFFVGMAAPASGTGDLTVALVNAADATKYALVKVSAGILTMTFVNGGADGGIVTRAVTPKDNVVRFTEASGTVLVEMSPNGLTGWTTLRSFTTPAWWTAVVVQLGCFSASSTAAAVFTNANITPVVPQGNNASSTLSDDYPGSTLDATKWVVSGPGTVTVANEAEIAAVSSATTQIQSVGTYTLDVASILVHAAVASSGDRTTFKCMSPTPLTDARFSLISGTIVAELRQGDVSDGNQASVTHDNTLPVYLQFTADLINQNLVWSYGNDGINYAVLRTAPLPPWYTGVQFAYAAKAA